MSGEIMVSVIMAAYNHEKYIRDAIESVIKQKTNFNYEVLIHDDASTDTTPKIIREYEEKYPDVIKAVYEKKNLWSQDLAMFRKTVYCQKIAGRYFAILECDDFWTDESKLQRQVDFLEAHQEYSMCMHNALQLNNDTGETKLLDTFPEDGTYSQTQQVLTGLGSNFPATGSYVLRTAYIKDMPDFFLEGASLDYPLRQYYANCGKIYYFKKPMSVYRVSVSNSYMSRLRKDAFFYNAYILKSIKFLEDFNNYTEKKFSKILESKMDSDYLGFCTSIEEEQGLKMASREGLDIDKVKACYECLSVDHTDSYVQKLCDKTNHLFIYGTSRLGLICKTQLEHAEIRFEGFVISDGQMKPETVEDRKVFYLSEVMNLYDNPGFILAVQPVNEKAIIDMLKKNAAINYCNPYVLKN